MDVATANEIVPVVQMRTHEKIALTRKQLDKGMLLKHALLNPQELINNPRLFHSKWRDMVLYNDLTNIVIPTPLDYTPQELPANTRMPTSHLLYLLAHVS